MSGSTGDSPESEEDEEARNKDESNDQATFRKRREFLETKLKNHRQDNLKRKLPVDAKSLECAQEELAMKKWLVEQVDKMNEKYVENMERMSNTMDKLTNSIADGFFLLRMMCQQPTAMYPPRCILLPVHTHNPRLLTVHLFHQLRPIVLLISLPGVLLIWTSITNDQ